MILLAQIEAVLLAAIAALHAAWGLGMLWPRHSELELVGLVVGYKRDRMPGPAQCFAAAGGILIAALLVGALAGMPRLPLPPVLVRLAGAAVALVFAGRGIAGYLPAWRARFPREPFATLDRRFYSPLCLVIALTCASLLLQHPGS